MDRSPQSEDRPNRLPLAVHLLVVTALILSFISGILLWRAQWNDVPARGWAIFHGSLNSVLTVLFGYLLCEHIRIGWRNKANRWTGLTMELVFAGLILTGAALYYAPEPWQNALSLMHRALGTLVPVTLGIHWWAGHRWAHRVIEK